ncbi:MAG: ABC transporter permease subunit [Peptococcaceae bacterium]|nr:ABC transporter permease subunit [Peptococcaceae bacterium]
MPKYGLVRLPGRRFSWVDLFVIAFAFALLYFLLSLGAGMKAPFIPEKAAEIDLNPLLLPYYAGRSLLRMFLAYFLSLLFTFVYGRIAAYYRRAGMVMVPLLDILQSIPVLGFLSVAVTGLIGLFPGSMLGPEMAAIFAIFTGQAWNMTFSFYYSVTALPKDLREVSAMTRLSGWDKFVKLEVPYSMIGLVWNSMMSFGGGWFFLAASEAITVLGKDIRLPGIGSYMATAIDKGDMRAIYLSVITMILVIVLVDQLFWRPVVAWSQKYKMELSTGDDPQSWFLNLLQRSATVALFREKVLIPLGAGVNIVMSNLSRTTLAAGEHKAAGMIVKAAWWAAALWLACLVTVQVYHGIQLVLQLNRDELLKPLVYGIYTFLRVLAGTLIGTLWTVPVGVAIGLKPGLSRIAQPLVQVAASFPANMVFPFITLIYLKYNVSMEAGAVPLMMLGTQWYILFNVIAGASAIPNDLKEAGQVLGLRTADKWRTLILPAIFPYLVTGWVTASGGAWNASIVSEVVSWQGRDLAATGLGAYITSATTSGNWPQIIWGISVMAFIVVATNRLIWKRLYRLAQEKYNLD